MITDLWLAGQQVLVITSQSCRNSSFIAKQASDSIAMCFFGKKNRRRAKTVHQMYHIAENWYDNSEIAFLLQDGIWSIWAKPVSIVVILRVCLTYWQIWVLISFAALQCYCNNLAHLARAHDHQQSHCLPWGKRPLSLCTQCTLTVSCSKQGRGPKQYLGIWRQARCVQSCICRSLSPNRQHCCEMQIASFLSCICGWRLTQRQLYSTLRSRSFNRVFCCRIVKLAECSLLSWSHCWGQTLVAPSAW